MRDDVHIRIFGKTSVVTSGTLLGPRALGGGKPRQILEILAISAGSPVPKEQLAELVWDGKPPRTYLATLESYVCLLRRALGLSRGAGSALATVNHGYLLDPARVSIDLVAFHDLAEASRVHADPATRLAFVQDALAQVSGELLGSEPYAAWAVRERERFDREVAALASDGARCALLLGRSRTATHLAREAISRDPYAEEAWRQLIDGLCADGRRSEALRAYFELRDLLDQELGTSPSPATTARYLAALQHEQQARSTSADVRNELRILVGLLRQSVMSLTGVEVPPDDVALVEMATTMAAAS
jgi:DNA-binding SARP family transcriptional activator